MAIPSSFANALEQVPELRLFCLEIFFVVRIGFGPDRKESVRRARNRAGQLRIRVSRWPLRCRVLPLATCKRGFLPPTRYRGPPVAYKPERLGLPPRFAVARRAIDFRNRTGVTRKRRR